MSDFPDNCEDGQHDWIEDDAFVILAPEDVYCAQCGVYRVEV